jgi:hypothetical protein
MTKKAKTMAKPATATTSTPRATQPPRVAPKLTTVTSAVPMPDRASNRGSKTSYPFEALTTVGMSFGVMNKTAKQLASIISNQNHKPGPTKRNPDGSIVYKTADMTDAAGNVTKVPTTEPETLPGKKYFAVDCDAKKDPDGASVRVFRSE